MKPKLSTISRISLFLVLLICGLLQLKISLFEQSQFSRPRPHSRLWQQQINPEYLTEAAENLSLTQGLSDKTLHLLQRALTLNPLYITAWVTLAELDISQGKKDKAREIMAYINQRMVDVARWRWRKTMLAYQLEDREILARDLAYAVAEIPAHRQQALDLAADLWPDAETRLGKLGELNLLHLFRYSLLPERLEQARIYWPKVRDNPDLKLRNKLRFIELLRQRGDFDSARAAWRQLLGTDEILYNGSFATAPLQTAFGWRIGRAAGSHWELMSLSKSGKSVFHLHFSGDENVNYHHLLQYFILPATGENTVLNCTLSGDVSCKNLTTEQRPYFEIVGVGTKSLRVKTPLFAATQEMTSFTLDFTAPSGCRQVYVRLRRLKSKDINCLIAGDIWITNLKITTEISTDD